MKTKINVLDGLRGLAALLVVLAHLPQISQMTAMYLFKNAMAFTRLAYISVDIFFILSGFLITRILIRDKLDGRLSFKLFYLKRSLRIFPIYYLAIILVGFLISWENLGYVSLYLSNYFFSFNTTPNAMRHTWSLAVEEHFYLFWPAVVFVAKDSFIKKYLSITVFLIILLSIIFYYSYFTIEEANMLVEKSTNTRFLSLMFGATIAYNEDKMSNFKRYNLLLMASIVAYSIAIFSRLVNVGIPYIIFLYLFSAIGSTFFFLYVLNSERKDNIIKKVFTSKLLVFLGSISYGLYLYHYPIYYFFGLTNVQMMLSNTTYVGFSGIFIPLVLVFVTSIVSYYFLELPIIRFKDKIAKNKIFITDKELTK